MGVTAGTALFRFGMVTAALVGSLAAWAADPPQTDLATCVGKTWPTIHDAEQRVTACARFLQGRNLAPADVAAARLARGLARSALGESVVATDDYQAALRHYDQAIDPRNPDVLQLYRRGLAREGMGESDKALEDFSEAIKAAPQRPVGYLERGVLLATRMRSFERAIADFNRALEIEPDNTGALLARGVAYSELGQHGRALADLDRVVALAPTSSDAFQKRGLARSRAGQERGAGEDYTKAIRLNGVNADALVGRAGLSASLGDYEAAIADLDEAIKLAPDEAAAFYNRGFAHFALGHYTHALDDYSTAVALDPKNGRAFNNRCLVRAILGRDLVRALADCDMALKLSPVSLDVRATRGFVYLKLGDPQLALNEYDSLLEADPNRSVALYGRGLALIAAGRKEEGEREKKAALAIDGEVADNFTKYGLK